MAEQTIDAALGVLGERAAGAARAGRRPGASSELPIGPSWTGSRPTSPARRPLEPAVAARLVARHGTQAPDVVALGRELGLLGPLVDGEDHLEAEVAWAARHELALSIDDVLARRMRLVQELPGPRRVDRAARRRDPRRRARLGRGAARPREVETLPRRRPARVRHPVTGADVRRATMRVDPRLRRGHHERARDRVRPGGPRRSPSPSASSSSATRRRATSATIPEAIWEAQLATAREVVARGRRRRADRRDRDHEPARDGDRLGSRDRRAGRRRDRLAEPGHGAVLRGAPRAPATRRWSAPGRGCRSTPTSAARRSARSWLEDPALRARAERGELAFGTVESFLIWRLTGGRAHVTDVSNASRTLLFDIHRVAWDDELLELMEVPRGAPARGPEPLRGLRRRPTRRSSGGRSRSRRAAGDQQAATFGQACFAPGEAKDTLRDGRVPAREHRHERRVASSHGLLTTVGWRLGPDAPLVVRARGLGVRRPARRSSGCATGSG